MAASVSHAEARRHHILSEIPTAPMAKADLKKVEVDHRKRVGECISRARKSIGWSQKELGDAISRVIGREPDTAQLSRWEAGSERPHFDTLLAVPDLHGALVIQLARLRDDIDVVVQISIRRTA